jgi:apolipoprotein N-acyltransferase
MARRVLLAASLVLSSCIMAAATESSHLSWAAWVSLLPIFITIRVASPRVALIYGALWGTCLYIFSSFSDAVGSASAIHTLGLLAAVPAIYTYLGARMTRRIGYAPLVLAVGWIIVELALQPANLHQGLLAGTQGDGNLMRIVGSVLGYIFVAFLIAFVNAQLLSLVDNIVLSISQASFHLPILTECRGLIVQASGLGLSVIFISDFPARAPPIRHLV